MNAPVFVDTNVFVYARDASEPAKQARAAEWIERLWRERRGRTSVQVLSEYFVTVTRKLEPGLAPAEAWDDLQALFAWEPQVTDATLLRRGEWLFRRHRLNWWDALVVAACEAQGCGVLLTEDLADGAIVGAVTVRSPFTFAVGEEAGAYSAAAVGRRLQSARRGRPARRRPAA